MPKPRTPNSGKLRVELRKNRGSRQRQNDITKAWEQADPEQIFESFRAKGDLTRKRTVDTARLAGTSTDVALQHGIVLRVFGHFVEVDARGTGQAPGQSYLCSIRRVLKTLAIADRSLVTVGDRVLFRQVAEADGALARDGAMIDTVLLGAEPELSTMPQGVIEGVEPRGGELCRRHEDRWHTLVANIDQLIVACSYDYPPPSPHLIDRYLIAAEAGRLSAMIVVNKMDLGSADDQRVRGLKAIYEPLGYRVLGVSAQTGMGVAELRAALSNKASAIAGQSGVGKSSMLNACYAGLRLRTGEISQWWQRGKHTTTTALLIPLSKFDPADTGYVADTPGVRQFGLWNLPPQEMAAYYKEFEAPITRCKFSNCTHTHETGCGVKEAVRTGEINQVRYDSYRKLLADSAEE